MQSGNVILAVVAIIAIVAMTMTRFWRLNRRRDLLHKERMAAIDKGVPIPEDTESDIDDGRIRDSRGPAFPGTILTALGLGLLVSSRAVPRTQFGIDVQQALAFLEVWAYPFLAIGLGLLVLAFFTRRNKSR
jgi:hypothetical protein